MTDSPPPRSAIPATLISGLRRLPDLRAALEGLALFIVVVLAGIWAFQAGVLELHPISSRNDVLALSLGAFLVPALAEELVFRGWLRKGAPVAAALSLVAFVAWHPLQVMIGSPFARPEFLEPGFLGLVAVLGLACSLSRLRSGSVWPAVIIHWGVAVIWKALFAGDA